MKTAISDTRTILALIWYDIKEDEIFMSGRLDAYFFSLTGGVNWDAVEILGEL